jgi:putative colanic acid biosynthesis acetyltransferase WcaF
MAPILLEAHAIVSQGAHLCAGSHDIEDPNFPLVVRPITIGEYAWVAAEAFVGPGVHVGAGAVLGARAVTFKDLEARHVYIGNPAQSVRRRVLQHTTTDGYGRIRK